jgi:SHS2 domain-containing protein
MWSHFPHDADVGVRGQGRTPAEAFEQAAMAMTAVITSPESVMPREKVAIDCAAPDLETLLVDWLNRLVLEMATRDMLFSRFEVEIAANALTANAFGEPVDITRHEPAAEVKGATFTALQVARQPDGEWVAQCVLDV